MPSLRKRKEASRPSAADEQLQESLDALGEGFALFDSVHTLVRCNKQFAALSSYPARLCRPGATLDALLQFAAERGDFGAGDRTALVTERLKHIAAGDGTIEACDVTRAVVVVRHRRLAEGYVLLTCTDKRDVHAAKEAMRATEERFALVAAAATEGYYDWDIVNDQLYVSPQLNRMFGFEAGYLKSRTWNDRVVDDDSEIYRRALLDHFKQRTARLQCEYRIRLASGEVRWVADRATAVHGIDGRAIRLVGAVSDVTAEKALAAALKDSEARYAHALDAIGEGLYEWDIVNDKTFYSPGVRREVDIPESELQTPQDWIQRIHPDDLPRFQAATRDHLRGLTPRFESEVRYRASDGRWRWARQHGLVVRDAEGRAVRLIGSTGDITQSKQLAEALAQAEARLQAAVEAASEGFVVWDKDDRLVTCNSVYRNFFRGAEQLVSPGNTFETIIRAGYDRGMFSDAGSDFDAWFARLQASRHNHSGHREQHVFDGQWLLVSDRALSSGGVVSVYADITENKRRELELADAVTRLGNSRDELNRARTQLIEAIEAISEGFVLFDANDRLIVHNSRFREFYAPVAHVIREGVSFREMLTETVRSGLMSTVDRPPEEWLEWRLSLHRNQTAPLDLRLSDGRWLSVNERRTLEGGVVGIYADITSLKEREEELSQTATSLAVARDDAEAALERQMATADILKVIASSPTDIQPVLDAVVKAALRFCGAPDAVIALRDDDIMHYAKHSGALGSPVDDHNPLDRTRTAGRAILEGRTIHIADITGADGEEFTKSREDAPKYGFKALVSAPMLREGVAIGCILLRKPDAGAFTPRQIELLETFAAQAVIAIENVRLFTELRDSLERLKAAQANLIQSEKMASLGQLTAGIAHEIKNPLNFVNNFAGLSVELLGELKEAAQPILAGMSEDARAEFGETIELITSNLDKIAEHGKRADGIVKSMLSHSRGGTGDWQASNINALVEEALNLAYHGARAQDNQFNIALERDFAAGVQPIELVPQDVTRVFLNLFGNGFYAANKRRRNGAEAGYQPTLKVSTRDLGEAVEIRVRDNGTGIPQDVRAKLFQPFFTTKPTGEGTGLGLSISYDIVTQQHGGSIDVESEPGSFTEFTVCLPRRRRVA
jgi:PAS domain S-box-containing protein